MSEVAILGSPNSQYRLPQKVKNTLSSMGSALADPVENFLKDAGEETKKVKTAVTILETGINTAQIVKKVAVGQFEPTNNIVKNLINDFTKSSKAQNIAKFLTKNKTINFLENSSLGKIVLANKENILGGISTTLKVLGVTAGGFELGKGIYQLSKGETYEGGWSIAKGSSTIVSALATTGPWAIAGLAVQGAYIGDQATKEYGWHKDEKGNAETAVQHIVTKTKETYKKESKKNGKVAGITASGLNATGQTVISAVSVVGGLTVKAVEKTGQITKKVGNKIKQVSQNIEKHGINMLKDGNFAQKVIGIGEISFAQATKTVGIGIEKLGNGISYVGEKGKKYVGQAVNYLEKKLDQVTSTVSNTVGKISTGVSNFASDLSNSVSDSWNSFVSGF